MWTSPSTSQDRAGTPCWIDTLQLRRSVPHRTRQVEDFQLDIKFLQSNIEMFKIAACRQHPHYHRQTRKLMARTVHPQVPLALPPIIMVTTTLRVLRPLQFVT